MRYALQRVLRSSCILALLLCSANSLFADQLNLALLRLVENPDKTISLTWKRPLNNRSAGQLELLLPSSFESATPVTQQNIGLNLVETRLYNSQSTLRQQAIEIGGLQGARFEVMLQVQLADGTEFSTVLDASNNRFEIPTDPERFALAMSYGRTGLIHISEGLDHLLFLLALVLLINTLGQLVAAVTAFTLAHSVTLALATFELVVLPAPPVEALIALSIVFLAAELLRRDHRQTSSAQMSAWQMAGFFGLLHGLGFAGALAEIGLPRADIPMALLMFNLGVEIGQLAFVIVLFGLLSLLVRLNAAFSRVLIRAGAYAIGGVASFWTIQRVFEFV